MPCPSRPALQEVEQNAQLRVLHEHSEKFDLRAEGVFKYLQIFTAMANRWGQGKMGRAAVLKAAVGLAVEAVNQASRRLAACHCAACIVA